MTEHPLDFLADCLDVPIECPECNMLIRLGGNASIWEGGREPTDEEILSDLCDCNVGFRVYVGDAPTEAAIRLTLLLDALDTMTIEERDAWMQSVRDDLGME